MFVQILDHGVDGVPFIAMELLEGESLAQRLKRVGRLSPAEASRILTQVARAVMRAHEAGIVHRDLKPDNVFLVRNDEDEIAKVLDFGIAKAAVSDLLVSDTSGTRTGAVLGTPYYMSPEQAEGSKSLDHRTDIWALGFIAYECLLGRRPFESEVLASLFLAICARPMPVPSQNGQVPAGFDAWFARACARDPQERFADARSEIADFRRICEPSEHFSTVALDPSVAAGIFTDSGSLRPGDSRAGRTSVADSGVSAASDAQMQGRSRGSFGIVANPPKPSSARLLVLLGLVLAVVLGVVMFLILRPVTPVVASTTAIAPSSLQPPPPVPLPAIQPPALELPTETAAEPTFEGVAPQVPPRSAPTAPAKAPTPSQHAKPTPPTPAPAKPAASPVKSAPAKPAINLGI